MQTWKTIAKKTLLKHSKWLTVEDHSVGLPDGRVLEKWPWLIMLDYTNVVTITTDGKFLCFRQPKYAVEGLSLAPVGGYLEPDEDPLDAAQRELLEETGYVSSQWTKLGQFAVDGNHGAGRAHLFLAQDAVKTSEPKSDDLEEQELLLLSRAEVQNAVEKGEFKVLSWATGFALALLHTTTPARK